MSWFFLTSAIAVAFLFDRIISRRIGDICDAAIGDRDSDAGEVLIARIKKCWRELIRLPWGRDRIVSK